jgi:hypothetical protein
MMNFHKENEAPQEAINELAAEQGSVIDLEDQVPNEKKLLASILKNYR